MTITSQTKEITQTIEKCIQKASGTNNEKQTYVPAHVMDDFVGLINEDIKRLEARRDFIQGVIDKFLKTKPDLFGFTLFSSNFLKVHIR